jgi:hypothetical protein
MSRFTAPITLRLEAGQIISWHRARPLQIEVLSGRIWLTQQNDSADHFVGAGSRIGIGPAAHALIGAETPVVLRLDAGRNFVGPLLRALGSRLRVAPSTYAYA